MFKIILLLVKYPNSSLLSCARCALKRLIDYFEYFNSFEKPRPSVCSS